LQYGIKNMAEATITVITETPKGSTRKYVYDKTANGYKVKKELPLGMCFPFDFGFIPGTIGEDGDALDALVIAEQAGFPGCITECRMIGALLVEQVKNGGKPVRNDRFLLIPQHSQVFEKIKSIQHLPEKMVKELQDFFVNYNKKENKKLALLGVAGPKDALKLLRAHKV
jgi:inorganic pyrophosphatase